jgi:uncharacterized protein
MTDVKPADLLSKAEGGSQTFYQIEDDWMETHTGKQFFFMRPTPDMIDVVDIAAALGKLCRYGGHTRQFYSVAEHSVLLARWLEEQGHDLLTVFSGLMHDATEGYLVDIPRPIKHVLADYKRIEDGLAMAIHDKFGVLYPLPRVVHEADSRILVDERAQAMSDSGNEWGTDKLVALGVNLRFWSPDEAPGYFLAEFERLQDALCPRKG